MPLLASQRGTLSICVVLERKPKILGLCIYGSLIVSRKRRFKQKASFKRKTPSPLLLDVIIISTFPQIAITVLLLLIKENEI